jgi:hypothetical protein
MAASAQPVHFDQVNAVHVDVMTQWVGPVLTAACRSCTGMVR